MQRYENALWVQYCALCVDTKLQHRSAIRDIVVAVVVVVVVASFVNGFTFCVLTQR